MPQRRAAARRLPAATGRRAPTDTAGFGWLVVTGLRLSARVGWDNDAVALDGGLRPSRHTTCRPSRSLPLPRTTPQALWRSVARRHRGSPIPNSPSFFVAEQGGRLPVCTVRATCVPRSRQIGWRGPTARPGPRLHDFRPRCAVQTLGRWYREGVEVARHRPALSTSLGPVTVRDTYWSLSTTPAFRAVGTQRREQAHRRRPFCPRTAPCHPWEQPVAPHGACATSTPVPTRSPATAPPAAGGGTFPNSGGGQRRRR